MVDQPRSREVSPADVSPYAPSIDGLRALAVTLVLLFHLDIAGLPGGFVGVDVFFVISGFLITSNIASQIAAGRFSAADFYVRRIRRLMPALFTMLLGSLLMALVWLKPEALVSFAKSFLAQAVSLQNIWFLSEGEYFVGADGKLLLHTWSLAVEEQFYFVWPWLLMGLFKLQAGKRGVVIATLIVASFSLSVLLMHISPKASFFLLPTRAWELAVGGVLALMVGRANRFTAVCTRLRHIWGPVGLALILASALLLTPQTPFPGWAAMPPVLGAACLVMAARLGGSITTRLLSCRPLVYLGLISYPLYLWHWPLIVAFRLDQRPNDVLTSVLIIGLTVLLATLTYELIEKPVRQKRWLMSTKRLLVFAGIGTLAIVGASVHMIQSDGMAYRFDEKARSLLTAPLLARTQRCGFGFKILHPSAPVCALTDPAETDKRVLLWGNSHADQWSALFADLAKDTGSAFYLNARNCRATPDHAFCDENVQRDVLRAIKDRQITDVVLSSTAYGAYGVPDEVFEARLTALVQELADQGVKVWLVIGIPVGEALDPIKAYSRNPASPEPGKIARAQHERVRSKEFAFFNRLEQISQRVSVIDASSIFCDSLYCYAGHAEAIWYRDSNHLTDAGARKARSAFEPVFLAR